MLKFEITQRCYAIDIDDGRFLDLLDSESHVTENAAFKPGAQTLCDKLSKLDGVWEVEYNGHFGGSIYLKIDDADDNDELKSQISQIINNHLKWCSKLKKRDSVIQRRKEND